MKQLYTIQEKTKPGAIVVSAYKAESIVISLEDYSEDEYQEFLKVLDEWTLVLSKKSWSDHYVRTPDEYSTSPDSVLYKLPLAPKNILIDNGKAVGFVLGHEHYPKWETYDDTVLVFFDGISLGRMEYEIAQLWGDYPSDMDKFCTRYEYRLAKNEEIAAMANSGFLIENGVLKKYTGPGWDLIIPEGVTCIAENVFRGCNGLTSVIIPDSVISIGNSAFNDCRNLRSVTIGSNVTDVGAWTFKDCKNLENIVIPSSVKKIGTAAFLYCDKLLTVYISDLKSWCSIRFTYEKSNPLYHGSRLILNGEEVTRLIIPDGVTEIGDYAFFGCKNLTSVIIPDSVTNIGDYVFQDCSNLRSVTIGSGVRSIYRSVFKGCVGLTSVVIDGCVISIDEIDKWQK